MHDIWNPWQGCKKISEGCDHWYMYFLDKRNGRNGREIYQTKEKFTYPMQKDWQGNYKIKSGELIRVCMSSDFFLEEADNWREEAWRIMKERSDVCGGENYDGARPCDFEWVKLLRKQCENHQFSFTFIETGTYFVKDGKTYHLPKKLVQSEMAYKSGMNYKGKEMKFLLRDSCGRSIEKENLYEPYFRENCRHCGSRKICNGCSDCGKCNGEILSLEEVIEYDK